MGLFDFVAKAADSAVAGVAPVLVSAAKTTLPINLHAGFDAGIQAVRRPTTATALNAVRSALPAQAKQGFDTALALAAGKAKGPPAPHGMTPQAQAAFHILQGIAGTNNPVAHTTAIMKTLSLHPTANVGVTAAVATIPRVGWWTKLLRALGLKK